MEEKNRQIKVARIVSGLCYPFFIPFLSYLALFNFTYLNLLQPAYKTAVLSMVFIFTIFVPFLAIVLFFYFKRWRIKEMVLQERRLVPYMLTFISYFTCYILMQKLNLSVSLSSIILSTLIVIGICTMTNLKWKISAHMAGMGGVLGGFLAMGLIFKFSSVGVLCFLILLSGVVGSARLILQRHTPFQLLAGFLIGFLVAFLCIIY